MKHVLHQTPLLSLTFASLSGLSHSLICVHVRLAPTLCLWPSTNECQQVVPRPGTAPGSNIPTPFLHPGHSLLVPKGESMLCSGLVAATKSVRAEIG